MDDLNALLGSLKGRKLVDLINEKKKALGGVSNLTLSRTMSIDKSTFDRILKKIEEGDVEQLNFFQVFKICQFFNISMEEMAEVYRASLKKEHVKELEISEMASFLLHHFDLKGLKGIGLIDDIANTEKIGENMTRFFGLSTIQDYEEKVGGSLFGKASKKSKDKMREFWIRSAYRQFELINNPNEFEREKLLALVPKIGPYTRLEEKGFLVVIQALYHVGITVLVQDYFSKAPVRGGTFVMRGAPCIVIANHNRSYSSLWFALLHEIYHVLFDLEELKAWKYHLTGELDMSLFREDNADLFAMESLLPGQKMELIGNNLSQEQWVDRFAEEHKIHPGIVYEAVCFWERSKHGRNLYPQYQKYFGKSDVALKPIKTDLWHKPRLLDGVEHTIFTLSGQMR